MRGIRIHVGTRNAILEIAETRDIAMWEVVDTAVRLFIKAGETGDGLRLTPYFLAKELAETRSVLHGVMAQNIAVAHELARRGTSIDELFQNRPIPQPACVRTELEAYEKRSIYYSAEKNLTNAP